MPELPEVEAAIRLLDRVATGRTIERLQLLHPALRKHLAPRVLRTLRGRAITRVERRGKHQLLHLDDGRALHAHFRMTGDWSIGAATEPPPRHARALLDFGDGSRLALVDPRALSTLRVHDVTDSTALPALGPEPDDPGLDARTLGQTLARRRGSIKVALLDQRVIAGLGNIYAVEALWRARIDPRASASSLGPLRRARLIAAARAVIARALRKPGRYGDTGSSSMDVYDREGKPCRRCGTAIRRIVQGGRSTYFCPDCQRR